jgi:2-keto-myo-inositol isomerase
MKLGLNGATIMQSPIERDVEIAALCGYGAIEFWAEKLDRYVEAAPLERLAEQVRAAGLAPSCINSIENITGLDATGRTALLDELRSRVAMARALGAHSIVVVPSCIAAPVQRERAIEDAADVLRAMSDVAKDVALAFEFLGKPGCTVPTLDMAIEIVRRVDRRNVGMVLDVFHFHAGGSELRHVRDIPLEKLLVVHLNDAEDLARDALTDAHRLYPGDGAIPLDAILGEVRDLGYDGVASIEIFRPEYWEREPADVARAAASAARSVLARSGFRVEPPRGST